MFASKGQRTVIAEGLTIVGSVTTEGLVEVYGRVEGEMHCTSLVITRKAHIVGSIKADNVVVDGTVEGPIECGEITFNSKANVIGDVQCRTLIIERGAFMEGSLRRLPEVNGAQSNGAKLLNNALTTPADRRKEAERIVETEITTRKAELIVEARHLSGNPELSHEEALAFLARRGNTQAKAFVEMHSEKKHQANGHA